MKGSTAQLGPAQSVGQLPTHQQNFVGQALWSPEKKAGWRQSQQSVIERANTSVNFKNIRQVDDRYQSEKQAPALQSR